MFRRLYGASPLHLLALIASLLIAGAAIAGWFDSFPGPTVVKILEWFLVAIVAHDLVLLPLYSLFDRIAFTGGRSRRAGTPGDHPRATNYVRIPAILSGLLFLVFFPEILRLGDGTFFAASGFHQRVYLVRYLLTCAGLFALAGLAYAFAVARSSAERRADRPRVLDPQRGRGGAKADLAGEQRSGGHEREHEVGPEDERRAAQPPSRREGGEWQDPEHVPGRGPAERGNQREHRHPAGGDPVAGVTPDPDRAPHDGEREQHPECDLQAGGLPAPAEREPDEVRDPDRGDEATLGDEVGEMGPERPEAQRARASTRRRAPRLAAVGPSPPRAAPAAAPPRTP